VSAVVDLTRSDSRIICVAEDFDRVPYELNTPSGVIDLRTCSVRERVSTDLFRKCTAVSPAFGGIGGSRFERFLSEITLGDVDLIDFLHRMLGACLFASNALDDHWFSFLVGSGRNGKGTLIEGCAAAAMGNYAAKIPTSVLMAQDHGERHSTELADFCGVRLAYSSEVAAGASWNESRLKELTGGDNVRARRMRQDSFEFVPTHRLLIFANHKPRLRSPDFAFSQRCRMVPFNATFSSSEEQSTTLRAQLHAELPAVLGWMISGARLWHTARRLRNCAAVDSTSEDYIAEQDDIGLFVAECCDLDVRATTASGILLSRFNSWKEARNERAWSQRAFSDAMTTSLPLIRKRILEGHRVYDGIAVRISASMNDDIR